jgi:hypothetical protein
MASAVIDWLLDADPAIRWQVMRDLTDEPESVVAAERARVATDGWGARLLALQDSDGAWGGGTYAPAWTSTMWTLMLLRNLGLDPESDQARTAVPRVRDLRWEYDPNLRFFEGEVEPCINGKAVAIGAYFGEDVRSIVERLLGEQMADGGWNCEQENGSTRGSFNTTMDVLEGLLEYERMQGADPAITSARSRAHEYLLERGLMRRRSTGELIDPDFSRFSYPTYWHYDVLRGLDYLRAARVPPDQRLREALALVESKRDGDGRWPLENIHPGSVHFEMEDGDGRPSRWNTLRALRVLRWAVGPVRVPTDGGAAA